MDVKITIVIAVSSKSTTLKRTLQSLAQCVKPPGLSRMAIVENGEAPRLKGLCERFRDTLPLVHCFTTDRGKSRALNLGVEDAAEEGDFILFTDDDIRFPANWITNYETAFREHGRGHFFGGSFHADYETPPDPVLRSRLPQSGRGLEDAAFLKNEAKNFYGFNWAAQREDLLRAGRFNENISHGTECGATGEETEAQRQLRRNGVKRVFIPENPVWHYVPREKCSYEWIKARSRTIGVEKYWRTERRGAWVAKRGAKVAGAVLKIPVLGRKAYYTAVFEYVKLTAFIGAWRKGGNSAGAVNGLSVTGEGGKVL